MPFRASAQPSWSHCLYLPFQQRPASALLFDQHDLQLPAGAVAIEDSADGEARWLLMQHQSNIHTIVGSLAPLSLPGEMMRTPDYWLSISFTIQRFGTEGRLNTHVIVEGYTRECAALWPVLNRQMCDVID
jgi:hypothetical protein